LPNSVKHYYSQIDRTFRDKYRARVLHEITGDLAKLESLDTDDS
jgi:hypothetical protein